MPTCLRQAHPSSKQVRRPGLPAAGCPLPWAYVVAASLAWAGTAQAAPTTAPLVSAQTLKLHVPSPDWRDQVIYFVVTDRYADGDPDNNNQGAGEYAPGQRSRYQGGDLKGLTQRLDYIKALGATTVWITPPVANQWVNPSGDYTGYHGYWAENMLQVDKHMGSLADYQALSHGLHSRGMYLVQDIVVNHMGNFFTYRDRWVENDPARGWEAHDQTPPVPRPSQPPFNLNDPRDPKQRAAATYHWTPDIIDYNQTVQEHHFQMSGLDDLNTENPTVRRALRHSFGHWIRQVGVDGFRVDTAFYVPPAFFDDFLHASDLAAPGVLRAARATGRKAFHVFGEGFGIDKPGQEQQARKIEAYVRAGAGSPDLKRGLALMPGMLNFPLFGSLGDVFARGKPPAELADRIQRTMAVHSRPHLMVNFLDNHDVDRFLAGGSRAGLQQALLAMFTLPGIPAITYGTEQGFTDQRASMFAAGWGSGGRDRFDMDAPLYRAIAGMAALRRQHRVLSRGVPTVLRASEGQAGVLAWKMAAGGAGIHRHRGKPQKRTVRAATDTLLVLMNTASHDSLLDAVATGLPPGTRLRRVYSLDASAHSAAAADVQLDAQGRFTLALPPSSGQVWRVVGLEQKQGARQSAPSSAARPVRLHLARLPAAPVSGDLTLGGRVKGRTARPLLVVNGDLTRAQPVSADEQGLWQAKVDTSAYIDPKVQHTAVLYDPASGAVSIRRSFRVERAWQLQAEVEDAVGDDTGPGHGLPPYSYPTAAGWGPWRQMDIRRVRVYTAGGALRVAVQTPGISSVWNPANGFDHVAFTLFIELPGRSGGAAVMPLQDGNVPDGLRWHLRLRAHGWSNALFGADGASATHEGAPLTPGAVLQVNKDSNEVVFTLPAAALGRLTTLSGTKLWLNTWDYDAGYRALTPLPQPYAMGGAPVGSPKVMDTTTVIVLP